MHTGMTWTPRWAISVVAGIALVGTAPMLGQNELFPHTRERGRAAVEFKDGEIHAVVAYYYSQRHHASRWLLIEVALSTTDRMVIHRNNITLVTPGGRELMLANQRRFGQDIPRVSLVIQNAAITRHSILDYFPQRRSRQSMNFFTVPGMGIVTDEYVIDVHGVASGDLFFESPTGSWEPGTYSLSIQHKTGRAALPIELD
jgi:hypothetical protein